MLIRGPFGCCEREACHFKSFIGACVVLRIRSPGQVTCCDSGGCHLRSASLFAQISHASPMAAATAILEHLEKAPSSSCLDPAPPGMEQILRVLGFMTRLGLDIFCWSLLRRLAVAQESALLADGQMAPWAAALASMAGHLCKRFSAVELAPFLRLCLGAASNAIKGQPDNEGSSKLPQPVFHELLVLQRLLEGLAEARQLDDLTVDQVDVEASGVLLRRSAQFRQVTPPLTSCRLPSAAFNVFLPCCACAGVHDPEDAKGSAALNH